MPEFPVRGNGPISHPVAYDYQCQTPESRHHRAQGAAHLGIDSGRFWTNPYLTSLSIRSQTPPGQMLKWTPLYPAVTAGTFQFILRRGNRHPTCTDSNFVPTVSRLRKEPIKEGVVHGEVAVERGGQHNM